MLDKLKQSLMSALGQSDQADQQRRRRSRRSRSRSRRSSRSSSNRRPSPDGFLVIPVDPNNNGEEERFVLGEGYLRGEELRRYLERQEEYERQQKERAEAQAKFRERRTKEFFAEREAEAKERERKWLAEVEEDKKIEREERAERNKARQQRRQARETRRAGAAGEQDEGGAVGGAVGGSEKGAIGGAVGGDVEGAVGAAVGDLGDNGNDEGSISPDSSSDGSNVCYVKPDFYKPQWQIDMEQKAAEEWRRREKEQKEEEERRREAELERRRKIQEEKELIAAKERAAKEAAEEERRRLASANASLENPDNWNPDLECDPYNYGGEELSAAGPASTAGSSNLSSKWSSNSLKRRSNSLKKSIMEKWNRYRNVKQEIDDITSQNPVSQEETEKYRNLANVGVKFATGRQVRYYSVSSDEDRYWPPELYEYNQMYQYADDMAEEERERAEANENAQDDQYRSPGGGYIANYGPPPENFEAGQSGQPPSGGGSTQNTEAPPNIEIQDEDNDWGPPVGNVRGRHRRTRTPYLPDPDEVAEIWNNLQRN